VRQCVTPPGDTMVSPLEDSFEYISKISPPLPRLCGPECEKASEKASASAPIKASAEASATASAKAKATTSALREAEAAIDACDERGVRLGAGQVPFECLNKAELFYGVGEKTVFAAALQDEVELILLACGIASGNSTRRQRTAVMHALCDWMAATGKSMEAAGSFGVLQRRMYLARAEGMIRKVDVRRFFAEGIWLEDWTSPAYQPRSNSRDARRTGSNPTIGMYQPN
jgi:hypothetical protein